jgi:hypothetical protein
MNKFFKCFITNCYTIFLSNEDDVIETVMFTKLVYSKEKIIINF